MTLPRWWWSVGLFLSVVVASAAALSTPEPTVLYFDGSLRPPRDPGFPRLPSPATMATAGVAVWKSGHLMAVGGCNLMASSSSTSSLSSAVAEYEALSFGLEHLSRHVTAGMQLDSLIIRGDCKTVLDQLRGKSIPRKLSGYHRQAKELLDEIRSMHRVDLDVSFQHVPRCDNTLCDALCAHIIELQCRSAMEKTNVMIEQLERQTNANELALRSFLMDTLERPESLIPYSARPRFYRTLASIACAHEKYKFLMELGDIYASHAKTWKNNLHLAKAIQYQLQAHEGLCTEPPKKLVYQVRRLALETEDGVESHPISIASPDLRHFYHESPFVEQFCTRAEEIDWNSNDGSLWVS